jgi:predicted nucleic acid-binding Zn finger protein
MKKIIVLIALIIAPAVSFGQSMFDKLENMDNVSSVIVNKDAFQLLSKFKMDDNKSEEMEVFRMIQNLELFKMFSTDDASVANQMETMVNSAVKSMNLTQLMRVKDKDSRARIYVKTGKNKDYVNEVLMYISGTGKTESMIMSLTGTIDINKLSELADKFSKDNGVKVKVN